MKEKVMTSALSYTQKIKRGFIQLRNTNVDVGRLTEQSVKVIDILDYISEKTNFTLQIDSQVRAEANGRVKNGSIPQRGRYSLEQLLDMVLPAKGLDYYLDGTSLHIIRLHADKSPKLELYDVSDLTAMGIEHHFEFFAMGDIWQDLQVNSRDQVFGLNFEEIVTNNHDLYYTETGIARLIKENVFRDSWQDFPRTMITSSSGKLFISHFPYVHQAISDFLQRLRDLAQKQIKLDTTFIICKSSFFKQMELEFSTIYNDEGGVRTMALWTALSREQEEKLFNGVQKAKDAFSISQRSLELHHLESRYVARVTQTHFLSGYDALSQQDQVGRMYEGVVSKVRPQLNPEQETITLDLDIDIAMINKPITSVPIADGEIVIPTQLTQHLSTQLAVPESQGVLLAGFANPYEEEGDRSFSSARKKDQLLFYFRVGVE